MAKISNFPKLYLLGTSVQLGIRPRCMNPAFAPALVRVTTALVSPAEPETSRLEAERRQKLSKGGCGWFWVGLSSCDRGPVVRMTMQTQQKSAALQDAQRAVWCIARYAVWMRQSLPLPKRGVQRDWLVGVGGEHAQSEISQGLQ